ncbi:MAG: GNAT family N-acetyltransferase, partial [Candidatus Dormibacteria bacterium]
MTADRLPPDPDLCLTTARLRLVPLVAADTEDLLPVLGDERLYRFIGGGPPSPADLRSRFSTWQSRIAPDGSELWLNWTVRLLADDVAVGYLQATVAEGEATIAYVIGTSWSGSGVATEAVRGMVQLLRDRLGVIRIVAHIHPQHAASAGVARHAGLSATGVFDDDG